jgi:hypothetical protein
VIVTIGTPGQMDGPDSRTTLNRPDAIAYDALANEVFVAIDTETNWEVHNASKVNDKLLAELDLAEPDNINVIGLPNPSGADADRLLADNELQIRAAVGLTLDSISKVKLGGREVVRIEYHGRVGTVAVDLHFLALVVPKPKQQLVVTASVAESRWEQVKRVVSGALDSIEID